MKPTRSRSSAWLAVGPVLVGGALPVLAACKAAPTATPETAPDAATLTVATPAASAVDDAAAATVNANATVDAAIATNATNAATETDAGDGGANSKYGKGHLREAAEFGMIGLFNAGASGSDGGSGSGSDGTTAKGNMWGDSQGDSFGAGGLGLSGSGGGGGTGEGIGLGNLGTLGHGANWQDGGGAGTGLGNGHGRLGGSGSSPRLRQLSSSVSGPLANETMQRIVRQNFGRFRLCYENGLRNDPDLAGNVGIQFSIDADGAVSNVTSGGSTLPDSDVVACVARGFTNLSFPSSGGANRAKYSIGFAPATETP